MDRFSISVGSQPLPEKDILIVDDEAGVRELFGEALQDIGYLADVAGTVSEAVRLLEQHRYQVALVDWRLPDGDGTVLASLAAETGAKTFIMSGYLAHLPPGGIDLRQTVMKPIRPAELVAIIRECIGEPSAASNKKSK